MSSVWLLKKVLIFRNKGLCFSVLWSWELLCFKILGFMCNCVLPATINATKLGNNRINQEKSCEAEETEKKKLRSGSSRENSTTIDTPSSSSSSPSVQVRGRSRKRRPRAMHPSSPVILGSSTVWFALFVKKSFFFSKICSSLFSSANCNCAL